LRKVVAFVVAYRKLTELAFLAAHEKIKRTVFAAVYG
jgi:hypothetical protein